MKRAMIFFVILTSMGIMFFSCSASGSSGGGSSTTTTIDPTTQSGYTTLFAGQWNQGSDDGAGKIAKFKKPNGITTDGTNLYICDGGNSTIRKIVISSCVVSTIAGQAESGGSTDGIGTAAKFDGPTGITTDGTNLYICDGGNNTIRKMVISSGEVSTIAGQAGAHGSDDGIGTAARFDMPNGITTDGTNLYIADQGNHTIRKMVISSCVVSTIAGQAGAHGSDDGNGTAARFYFPTGITTDGTNLYITDQVNHTIRKIVISSCVVSTIAGKAGAHGSDDGTGTAAGFYNPNGITTDGTNLYICDVSNDTIRKIVISSCVVSTIAGKAGAGGSTNGIGTTARFDLPTGITTDGINFYITETGNSMIRKIVK
jgi:hypothetical protein